MMDGSMSIDIFAKKPELRLPSGEKKYNTCIGWCCTMIYYAAFIACIYFNTMLRVDDDPS